MQYNQRIDVSNVTKLLVILLILNVILNGIALVSDYVQLDLLTSLRDQTYGDNIIEMAELSDTAQQIIGGLQTVLILTTFVVAAIWLHHAHRNVSRLGATHLKFSPRSSFGWYFVPFMNLFKPYQAMKEIWKASHNPQNWQSQPHSSMLIVWWIAYLVDGVVSQFSFRMAMKTLKDDSLYQSIFSSQIMLLSDITSIISVLLFLWVVSQVDNAQKRQAMPTQATFVL